MGKVFNRVLLNRMKDAIDPQLREQQAGFRKNRSSTDQIATLRIMLEQPLEWTSLHLFISASWSMKMHLTAWTGVLYGNATENYVAWISASTLVYSNSSLNLILYWWKIVGVKKAVKSTIRKLDCF